MDEKLWYQSKAVWGGLIAVGAAVASGFGVVVDSGTQGQIADLIIAGVGVIGGLLAIYGRVKAGKTIK